ncbi:MAG: CPBP family intramembrane metalloprotease, partial [candidate division Zixibacteria bacterium]|nr:CPBP family intramembrane metalloprotease [candidate division Zixibacteria bacterium]
WVLIGLIAMAIGGMATLAILISGAAGNPLVKQLTFPQIILFVWVLSSTIEEIFTRGFIQSNLAKGMDISKRVPFLRVDFPTFIGAAVFALMHLVLWLSGTDLKTMLITILFTFSLGLLAGHQRAKSGSLIPAIGVHMLANIGGLIGGIIYAVVTFLASGKLPMR